MPRKPAAAKKNPARKALNNDLNQILLSGRVYSPPDFNPAFVKKNGTTAPKLTFLFANNPFNGQKNIFSCEAWGVVAQKLVDFGLSVGHGLWISGTISARTLNVEDQKFFANFIYVAKFAITSRPQDTENITTHTEDSFVQEENFEELFPPPGVDA